MSAIRFMLGFISVGFIVIMIMAGLVHLFH